MLSAIRRNNLPAISRMLDNGQMPDLHLAAMSSSCGSKTLKTLVDNLDLPCTVRKLYPELGKADPRLVEKLLGDSHGLPDEPIPEMSNPLLFTIPKAYWDDSVVALCFINDVVNDELATRLLANGALKPTRVPAHEWDAFASRMQFEVDRPIQEQALAAVNSWSTISEFQAVIPRPVRMVFEVSYEEFLQQCGLSFDAERLDIYKDKTAEQILADPKFHKFVKYTFNQPNGIHIWEELGIYPNMAKSVLNGCDVIMAYRNDLDTLAKNGEARGKMRLFLSNHVAHAEELSIIYGDSVTVSSNRMRVMLGFEDGPVFDMFGRYNGSFHEFSFQDGIDPCKAFHEALPTLPPIEHAFWHVVLEWMSEPVRQYCFIGNRYYNVSTIGRFRWIDEDLKQQLHEACDAKAIKIVKHLMSAGCYPDIKYALKKRCPMEIIEVIGLPFEHDEEPDMIIDYCFSPDAAPYEDAIAWLLKHRPQWSHRVEELRIRYH